MSWPIAACGPEKVLMKPILIVLCARAPDTPKAMAAIVAAPKIPYFISGRSLLALSL